MLHCSPGDTRRVPATGQESHAHQEQVRASRCHGGFTDLMFEEGGPMHGVELSVLVALGAGLLSFLSPCVLPLVPSYLSYVSGISVDEFTHAADDSHLLHKVMLNSVLFIVGFSAVFMTFGLSSSLIGQALVRYQETIRMVAGVFIGFFGLYVVGGLESLARLADVVETRWRQQPTLGVLSLLCRPLLVGRYLIRTVQLQVRNRPAGYVGSVPWQSILFSISSCTLNAISRSCMWAEGCY
jgi:cytochrome c biogenesis protein CcdA